MLSLKSLLCIPLILIVSVSCIYAKLEKENKVELAPSAVLEIDILLSFADDDKSGSAAIGRLEAGIEAAVGEKVEAGLFIELGDEDVIGLLETWFTFKPVDFLSLTAGQLTMPFGEYATELQTDPFVMCGCEIDSSNEIPGAETIFPGFIAGVEIAGFSAAVGAYNSSYSELLEAFTVKMGYSFKEIVYAGVSTRFETGKKIDLDVNLTLSPWSFLALIGEVYTGLNDEGSDSKLLGIHSELDIMPIDPLLIAVRFGRLVDNSKEGSGGMQLGGCVKYSVNDHITFGLEVNGSAVIIDGETGSFDDLGVRIGFGIE